MIERSFLLLLLGNNVSNKPAEITSRYSFKDSVGFPKSYTRISVETYYTMQLSYSRSHSIGSLISLSD